MPLFLRQVLPNGAMPDCFAFCDAWDLLYRFSPRGLFLRSIDHVPFGLAFPPLQV
jgi:hypothetical protein